MNAFLVVLDHHRLCDGWDYRHVRQLARELPYSLHRIPSCQYHELHTSLCTPAQNRRRHEAWDVCELRKGILLKMTNVVLGFLSFHNASPVPRYHVHVPNRFTNFFTRNPLRLLCELCASAIRSPCNSVPLWLVVKKDLLPITESRRHIRGARRKPSRTQLSTQVEV